MSDNALTPTTRLCIPTEHTNKTGTVYCIDAPVGNTGYAPLFPEGGKTPYRFRTAAERDAKLESVNAMLLKGADRQAGE